jgi:hypothetical protein
MDPVQNCKFPRCLNIALIGADYCLIHAKGRLVIGKDITLATNLEIERRTPFKEQAVGLSTSTSFRIPLQSVGVMILDPNKYRIPLGWTVPKVDKDYTHVITEQPKPTHASPVQKPELVKVQNVMAPIINNVTTTKPIVIQPTQPMNRNTVKPTRITPTVNPITTPGTGIQNIQTVTRVIPVPQPIRRPPHVINPRTIQPVTKPVINPLTVQPVINPRTIQPVINPLTVQPITVDPLTVQPITVDPLTVQPITVDPLTVRPITVDPLTDTIGPTTLRDKIAAGKTPLRINKKGIDVAFIEAMLDEVIGEQDSDIENEKDYLGIINGLLENHTKSDVFQGIHPTWIIFQSLRINNQGMSPDNPPENWYQFGDEGGEVTVERGGQADIYNSIIDATIGGGAGIGMIIAYDRHANSMWFQMDTDNVLNIWRYEPSALVRDRNQNIIDSTLRGFFDNIFEGKVPIKYHPHRLEPDWQVQGRRGADRLYKSDYFCEDYSLLYIENRAAGMDHEAAAFELVSEGEDILIRLRRLLREMTEYAKNNY